MRINPPMCTCPYNEYEQNISICIECAFKCIECVNTSSNCL